MRREEPFLPFAWMLRRDRVWPRFPLVTYAEVVELLERAAPGSWREVATLPHEEVHYVELMGVPVPAFLPTEAQLERAAWRRRRWFGPVSPRPRHLAAAATAKLPYIVRAYEYRLTPGCMLPLANDGGVCEPLGWVGDQA